jgi:hypothetical protein
MAFYPIPFRAAFGRTTAGRPEGRSELPEVVVDLSLLLAVLDPVVTPEEEAILRRLVSARVAERPLRAAGFGRGW